ncbi:N-acetylneuraminate lyase-like isoform X2 [Hyposmocoma kahamanoa]|uniref:N-acetylneuraminate lyase-like isoform X2 n=1 Tax=Hyposmocoma kahamanoa TaxID=1477025 RepID=UPI000E6D6910|nr:N-acetylneuraminate lyase-like isoform X2 [Hyposmocoma kahamanoa]
MFVATADGDSGSSELKTRGLVLPAFTALNDDGTINYENIPAYAKYYADHGITSVLVGGTSGEHTSLTVADRKSLIDAWLKAGREHGLKIMAQVGGAPLPDVLNMTSYYASAGVSTILTLPELYFRPNTVDELVDYVALVANEADNLPILYYHYPKKSNVNMNMPNFVKTATERIPNFKGLKYSASELGEAYEVLRILKPGQEIFLGSSIPLAAGAFLGIKSYIGGPHNYFLSLVQDIMAAVERNDVQKVRELQETLTAGQEAVSREGTAGASKAAMELITGLRMGPPHLPQKPISEESKNRLKQNLLKLGFATQ